MAAGFMLTVTLCLLILSAAVLFVLIQLVKRCAAAAIDDIMGVEEGECVSKLEQVRLLKELGISIVPEEGEQEFILGLTPSEMSIWPVIRTTASVFWPEAGTL